MSTLLTIEEISKAYGSQLLFDKISFAISEGEQIGLIGINGTGKSTLLKILAGLESPDEGRITRRKDLILGYAGQFPEFAPLPLEELLVNSCQMGNEKERLTHARTLLGKAQFTGSTQEATALSGGWKKRLDILRALMSRPNLLLLDEPTNHLDLEGILWLEAFLRKEQSTYIVISHDRYFLDRVCGKIIELDRAHPQGIFISAGGMNLYTERKRAFQEGLAQQQRGLSSVVRLESDWLRKSPKARTTKSQARVDRAHELQDELSDLKRRSRVNKVDLAFTASERATRKLLMGRNLSKILGGKTLFNHLDLTLSPGSRLGIIGKNGTGKSSLLKMLAGALPPDVGTIKYADDLKIAYFDQHRERIPPQTLLKDALASTSDYVTYRGQQIHVHGWAKRFLFSPDRLALPVGVLSGGEQARILIARLILEPADLLLLDEPTNDLDIPTLEVIEESLNAFNGAVVLISHDRCLMDRICTEVVVLGEGEQPQFFADYSQWEKIQAQQQRSKKSDSMTKALPPKEVKSRETRRLSYKEERELAGIEHEIMHMEQEVVRLEQQLAAPEVQTDSAASLELYRLMGKAQAKLEQLFARWEFLENKLL